MCVIKIKILVPFFMTVGGNPKRQFFYFLLICVNNLEAEMLCSLYFNLHFVAID